ncbi:uncharacterized protein LOC135209379 [Macrobrachium nipponense]|uniref:uncharacterized protein LOC135209379 n=1 Tax=Macrobrachium nipponense TaxID=159736 RepID=UPI0030C7ABF1
MVFSCLREQHDQECEDDILKRTAAATGISVRSIQRIKQQHKRGEMYSPPPRTRTSPVTGALDNFDKARLVKELGFRYKKVESDRKLLVERNDIVLARNKYPRLIDENRKFDTSRPEIYVDETCLIGLGNASNHSKISNKAPVSSSKKAEIVSWLTKHNIAHDPSFTKCELLDVVKQHKYLQEYEIDKITRDAGHEAFPTLSHSADPPSPYSSPPSSPPPYSSPSSSPHPPYSSPPSSPSPVLLSPHPPPTILSLPLHPHPHTPLPLHPPSPFPILLSPFIPPPPPYCSPPSPPPSPGAEICGAAAASTTAF